MFQELSSCDSNRLCREDVVWRAGEQGFPDDVAIGENAERAIVEGGSPFGGAAKRGFDLVISLLLLPIAALVAVPIACLVALDGGSPIYSHTRVGWNGRLFRCYKFRTMYVEAEHSLQRILEQDEMARQEWLDRFKLENDPRVTPLGQWLRKTYLDEIPQIWNVLKGEMSWVGPRPVIPAEMCKYGALQSAYLCCRPGVSGLWQINRRNETTYGQRVDFDVQYARKWSAARDIMIMLLTIPRIVFADSHG